MTRMIEERNDGQPKIRKHQQCKADDNYDTSRTLVIKKSFTEEGESCGISLSPIIWSLPQKTPQRNIEKTRGQENERTTRATLRENLGATKRLTEQFDELME